MANQTVKTCSYALTGYPGERCGKPTKYRYVVEEDGERYRDWDHLCPDHRIVIDKWQASGGDYDNDAE